MSVLEYPLFASELRFADTIPPTTLSFLKFRFGRWIEMESISRDGPKRQGFNLLGCSGIPDDGVGTVLFIENWSSFQAEQTKGGPAFFIPGLNSLYNHIN